MKYAKKIMAACAATALLATMTTTSVFAIEGTSANDTTGTTTVKYEVTEGYTWSIPAVIDFGKDAGVNKTNVNGTAKTTDGAATDSKVSVTKNVIAEGKKLQITAKGSGTEGAFTIKSKDGNGSKELTYTIKVDSAAGAISAGASVLDVPAGTNTKDAKLTFTLSTTEDAAETAGSYQGTVTYTASVVDAD